jgi:hypothetical protein
VILPPTPDDATRARLVVLATYLVSANLKRRRLVNDVELDPARERENAPAIAALDREIDGHVAQMRLALATID